MKLFSKWMVGLAGLITLLDGGVLVITSVNIKPLSKWLTNVMMINPRVSQMIFVIFGIIAMITGLLLLLIGLFKARTVNAVRLQGERGKVTLPVSAMEKDLQRRIADVVGVSRPEVQLRLHNRKHRADVHVNAIAAGDAQFETLGSEILQVVQTYLADSLNFTLGRQKINVVPITATKMKARVV
ncbi:alkaline shock response membrane anchor protein AmaP [Furfurilactobacillus sp. WILCCON 0119]